MPSYGHLYSSYFKATDVTKEGLPLTIVKVKPELPSRDAEKEQLVLYVEEDPRGVVLNVTRYNAMVSLFDSDDTDAWVGGKIKLIPHRTTYKGKPTQGYTIAPID